MIFMLNLFSGVIIFMATFTYYVSNSKRVISPFCNCFDEFISISLIFSLTHFFNFPSIYLMKVYILFQMFFYSLFLSACLYGISFALIGVFIGSCYFLNSASTEMPIPPRTVKSAVILHQRGARAATISSKMTLVTCSWNVPSLRKDCR